MKLFFFALLTTTNLVVLIIKTFAVSKPCPTTGGFVFFVLFMV